MKDIEQGHIVTAMEDALKDIQKRVAKFEKDTSDVLSSTVIKVQSGEEYATRITYTENVQQPLEFDPESFFCNLVNDIQTKLKIALFGPLPEDFDRTHLTILK